MMNQNRNTFVTALLAGLCLALTGCQSSDSAATSAKPTDNAVKGGLLHWRGPMQNGNSFETGLPSKLALDGPDANLRWSLDTPGRGTSTVAEYADGPRMFSIGYPGGTADLLETLYCLNPETGEIYWQRGYADFISDIVYNRYSISAPTIDPETGNVFYQTSPGLVIALDRDGNELWKVSLMETYGKLTFPNGRTGVITIDGDLAIVNCISTNWGSEGPARNRFYAFDKHTGELVWSSTPGVGPPFLKDSSFSTPKIENRRGYRVFYAGTGCGNLVCVNVRTGQPVWRFQMSYGGVNASPVIYDNGTPHFPGDDLIIQTHGRENVGDTGRGYMIAIRADQALASAVGSGETPLQINKEAVAWRNDDITMFTSSPTLIDGVVYQCTLEGLLVAVDAKTGETLWEKKFGTDQLHSSPVYADGKIYLAMWHDGVYVFDPGRSGPKNIEHLKFSDDELFIGTPSVWNGKVYIHSTKRLMCFGNESGGRSEGPARATAAIKTDRTPTSLLVYPSEFVLRPRNMVTPYAYLANDVGVAMSQVPTQNLKIDYFIPPTAKVKAKLNAEIKKVYKPTNPIVESIGIIASPQNTPSAGALKATAGDLTGTARGRILPVPPYAFDFESFDMKLTDKTDNVPYAHPPLPWIGARLKWQVRQDPTDADNQVLAKTLDRVLFQRSLIFMGHADDTGYTIQADVMSDGNRRGGSVVGVICQRYLIVLDANKKAIEVSSNPNRIQVTQKFPFKTKTWYTIKAKVVEKEDGNGTVYGKAWPKGEEEPAEWTIKVDVPNVHTQGSPGIYGFSPQSRHRVYVDNVDVTPTK